MAPCSLRSLVAFCWKALQENASVIQSTCKPLLANFAQLLQAIAALLWPIFAFFALWTFRPQIRELLSRLKKGKLLGQEIELGESLAKLEMSAVAAQSEVAKLPAAGEQPSEISREDDRRQEASAIERVLTMSAQSPKAALLLLASELEREVRQLLASLGLLRGRRSVPIQQAIAELDAYGLPKHVPSSLRLFWDVRSRLVHGHQASEADTLSAIDSGIAILRALNAVPHELNVVYHPGVAVFTDAACTQPLQGVKGVILETTSPGGASKTHRIFPTTRSHFVKGKRVSWEWSDQIIFGEAWYRTPDVGEVKIAWSSSMEFIGRSLDEL
jgi:hypothetical protein